MPAAPWKILVLSIVVFSRGTHFVVWQVVRSNADCVCYHKAKEKHDVRRIQSVEALKEAKSERGTVSRPPLVLPRPTCLVVTQDARSQDSLAEAPIVVLQYASLILRAPSEPTLPQPLRFVGFLHSASPVPAPDPAYRSPTARVSHIDLAAALYQQFDALALIHSHLSLPNQRL